MIGRRATVFAAVLAMASACGSRDAQKPGTEFEVGPHRVRLSIPAGWDVLDQGTQKRFLKGDAELVLQDLGPAAPQGVRREVERARELWRVGRAGEAQLRLSNVHVPSELFPTADAREAFQSVWYHVSIHSVVAIPFADVEPDFAEVLARLDALPPRDLTQLTDWGLAAVGHDQRRDIKSRRPMTVDGREAVDITTWYRLDHTNPQRLLFVLDDGDLLVLHTPRAADPESVKAFESIRDSLHFATAGAADSVRR